MTFAPRSWPSKPALATMTRSGRAGALAVVISELGRLRVAAVDLDHRFDDLALGGDRAHAVDQPRHDVLVARAGPLERRQRRLDRGRVAAGAHRLHRARLA